MKNRALLIVLIVILSITSVLLLGGMIFLLNNNTNKGRLFNFRLSNVSQKLVVDEEYENNFERILIDAKASDINIKRTSGERVRVVVYGEGKDTFVNTNSGDLIVQSKRKACTFFCLARTIDKIIIYLPSDFTKKVKITNNYGDIEIDKFNEANFEIESDFGDVDILGAQNINVRSDFGDIEILEAKDVFINSSAGDIDIDTVEALQVQNDFGDIDVKRISNSLKLESDSGDITLKDVILKKSSSIKNGYGDIEINYIRDVNVNADTGLGDEKVRNSDSQSNIYLNIENGCGDIFVNY